MSIPVFWIKMLGISLRSSRIALFDSAILLLSVAETWSADPPPIPETRNKFLIRPFSQNRRGFIGPGRSCPDEEVRREM